MSSPQSILERALDAHDNLGPATMRVITRTRQGIWVTSTVDRQYRLNDWEHFQAIEQRCKPRLRWYVDGDEAIVFNPERKEWCRSPLTRLSACNDGGFFGALAEIRMEGALSTDMWDAMLHANVEPAVLGQTKATHFSWQCEMRIPEITSHCENGQTKRIPSTTMRTKGTFIMEEDSGRIRAYEFSAAGPIRVSIHSSIVYEVHDSAFPSSVYAFEPPPDAAEVDAESDCDVPRTWDRKGTFRAEVEMHIPS